MVCTIFVLPKWIEKQRELDDLKLQNEAMALKTKKFVQFLSSEKVYPNEEKAEERNLENVNDEPQGNEDQNSNLEEKKDK